MSGFYPAGSEREASVFEPSSCEVEDSGDKDREYCCQVQRSGEAKYAEAL